MNTQQIIQDYLVTYGYDGLYHDNECGCLLHDLAPCGCIPSTCKPGHKLPGDSEFDFYVGPEKQ